MAQRTQLNDASNPLHEAYAGLLANGLDGAGEASAPITSIGGAMRSRANEIAPSIGREGACAGIRKTLIL